MILDNVNPDDLYPTETKGPAVLGDMPYTIQGTEHIYQGAYIATNERLILNVDMDGQFYYRSIRYDELQHISHDDASVELRFDIGTFPISNIEKGDIAAFVDYVKAQAQL